MRVLVTGHKGYIGCIMTRVLARAGHEVAGLDADLYRACTLGPALFDVPWREDDLRDVGPEALAGVDAVVHLAALSNDPLSELDAELTHEINHRASLRLARLARDAGVRRFVFASSCSVYGAGGDGVLTERSPRRPLTAYGVSKARVEDGLADLADDRFSPTSLRNATAFGASPRLRLDVVLNDLVAQAVTTGVVRLRSDGRAWRPMVHIEDIARAALAVLEAPRALVHGQVFNVGSSRENHRIIDMAERVRDRLPGVALQVAAGAATDARDYHVDCEELVRRLPAAAPRWTLEAGIDELARTYRALGLTEADAPRYVRLAEIRRRQRAGELGPDLRRVARPAVLPLPRAGEDPLAAAS